MLVAPSPYGKDRKAFCAYPIIKHSEAHGKREYFTLGMYTSAMGGVR